MAGCWAMKCVKENTPSGCCRRRRRRGPCGSARRRGDGEFLSPAGSAGHTCFATPRGEHRAAGPCPGQRHGRQSRPRLQREGRQLLASVGQRPGRRPTCHLARASRMGHAGLAAERARVGLGRIMGRLRRRPRCRSMSVRPIALRATPRRRIGRRSPPPSGSKTIIPWGWGSTGSISAGPLKRGPCGCGSRRRRAKAIRT